jgi:hypothetical protein
MKKREMMKKTKTNETRFEKVRGWMMAQFLWRIFEMPKDTA